MPSSAGMQEILNPIERFVNPLKHIQADYDAVYNNGEVIVGWPEGSDMLFQAMARNHTVAIIGTQFGDEGKGRVVDNRIESMLKFGAKTVNVVRYQGGANAGHTIYTPDGGKIALHQLPSGILYEEAVGIMDRGMIIHPEDLKTEIMDAESRETVGDLRGKLILSPEAMLCTDLDRAQEVLNRELSAGKSSGGTGRGIGPTAADRLSRRGSVVGELFSDDWESKFAQFYDLKAAEFNAHGKSLADFDVPDLETTNKEKKPISRKLGSKQEYLGRLADVRRWFLERDEIMPEDKKLLQNTFMIHQNGFSDLNQGFLFEGSQAVGLDPNYGRIPDVTSSNTTIYGIAEGTQFPGWNTQTIKEKFGVAKLTYMSSVGAVRMITDSGIERRAYSNEEISSLEDPGQRFAARTRMEANEFGATTGRARDILFLDMALLRYNAQAGGFDMLAGTHLDIAHEGEMIKVCTHYTDLSGNYVPYQPGIEHQKNLIPQYIELPGWDGEATRRATCFDELPDNAKKYLAFLQRSTGRPITFVTTGPERVNSMNIGGYPREV